MLFRILVLPVVIVVSVCFSVDHQYNTRASSDEGITAGRLKSGESEHMKYIVFVFRGNSLRDTRMESWRGGLVIFSVLA